MDDIKYFPIKKLPDIKFIKILKQRIKERKKKLKIKSFDTENKIKLIK